MKRILVAHNAADVSLVYVYMQFTDGANNIGSVITREITVSMS